MNFECLHVAIGWLYSLPAQYSPIFLSILTPVSHEEHYLTRTADRNGAR